MTTQKRFAFYGRVSTEDQQDPRASRAWQMSRSNELIRPVGGLIVREFFDIGHSRVLPWKRRPQAAALLRELANPNRGFEAVVIGEPQRAFHGNHYGLTFPLFPHYQVELWCPEVGGRIDPGSEAHDFMMNYFGGMAKAERNRIKIRVHSAMEAMASSGDRFLGGRPPYGYRLVDAGPHPNPGKAADGKRRHQLDLDPITAPLVERIFTEYLGGKGIHAIAEDLNREGIPSPSGYDPERNRHRAANRGAWGKRTVHAIIGNPKYTGYQVWNRQSRKEVLLDPENVAAGERSKLVWNDMSRWVWPPGPTHPAIITKETFDAAAALRTRGGSGRSSVVPRRRHTYCLSSRVFCDICGRRMQGSWNHGSPYYRCIFPAEYAGATGQHPRAVYLRESSIVPPLDEWLADAFEPQRLTDTIIAMVEAQMGGLPPSDARRESIRSRLTECDREIEHYKRLLFAGTDANLVAGWINQAQAERVLLERDLATIPEPFRLSNGQVTHIVSELGNTVADLVDAGPEQRQKLYSALGLRLTYKPDAGIVHLESRPTACTQVSVGGGTCPPATRTAALDLAGDRHGRGRGSESP